MKDIGSIIEGLGVIMIIFIPGLTANILAFYCVIPDLRRDANPVKTLLLLLSTADVSGCIGLVLLKVVNQLDEIPVLLCSFASFLVVFSSLASGSVTTYMAVERCVALKAPYWYQANMFSWIIWAPLVCVCITSALICLLPEMGLGYVLSTKVSNNETFLVCGSLPMDSSLEFQMNEVFPVALACFGLILVLVTISCNVAVLFSLRKMIKVFNQMTKGTSEASHEFKMTKMLLCLSVTFLICWAPFNIDLVYRKVSNKTDYVLTALSHILYGINFAIDPFIYISMKRKYRWKVLRICCRKPKTAVDDFKPKPGDGVIKGNVTSSVSQG